MKVLRLRFRNLNSLRGEWEIDFTRPPLSDSGLFAITGPTGAGKTTLLDAITLALYGRAARYGTQSSPETMMSRHTGECSAEVEFHCGAGRFRSVWQMHRAGKKPGGAPQPPKRKVIQLPDEVVICEKIQESQDKVIELTGLDYDRFLRSVLLAQGEFAAFLKANARDRTELLQQVTGTGIYQEISAAAHLRAVDARNALELLESQRQTLPILSPEERRAREQERDECVGQLGQLGPQIQRLDTRIAAAQLWIDNEDATRKLAAENALLAAEITSAEPSLQRLAAHERAIVFSADLAGLDGQLKEQADTENRLRELGSLLPNLEKGLQDGRTNLDRAKANVVSEEKRQQELSITWDKVTELDKEIAAATEAHQQLKAQLNEAESRLTELERRQSAAAREHDATEAERTGVETWLRDHAGDREIEAQRVKIETQFERWKAAEAQAAEASKVATTAAVECEKLATAAQEAAAKVKPLESAHTAAVAAADLARQNFTKVSDGRALTEIEVELGQSRQRRESLDQLAAHATRFRQLAEQMTGKQHRLATLRAELTRVTTLCHDRTRERDTAEELHKARQTAASFAERIQSLEEHRASLVEGQPCPLCGATEHPFASPDAQLPGELTNARLAVATAHQQLKDAQDRLTQAEKTRAATTRESESIATEIENLEKEIQGLGTTWSAGAREWEIRTKPDDAEAIESLVADAVRRESTLTAQVTSVRAAEKELQDCREKVQQAQTALADQRGDASTRQALSQQASERLAALRQEAEKHIQASAVERDEFTASISAFSPSPASLEAAAGAIAELRHRAETCAKHQAQLTQLESRLGTEQARLEGFIAQAKSAREIADQARSKETVTRQRVADLAAARRQLFGDRTIADARAEAATLLRQLQSTLHTTQEELAQGEQRFTQASQEKSTFEQSLTRRTAGLQRSSTELTSRARESGFASIDSLRTAVLPPEERTLLQTKRAEIDRRKGDLETRSRLLTEERTRLAASAAEDAPGLTGLRQEKQRLETQQTDLNQKLGAAKEALTADDQRRLQQAGIEANIQAARREHQRWERLRHLIGSADGSAFARFAQGLTLERLVSLANRHLDQLNPRYHIRRPTAGVVENLELEIVDHYQADVSRPMLSLSGGESFLVSLALALGLSELASGATAIESIFIDEGFGTLDADSLEVAMAALENLQASGKTIGIISHVPAMQERIASQIRIIRESGGCSRIEI